MKEHSSQQKKTASRAIANQTPFQKKPEQEPFLKSKGSDNSLFSPSLTSHQETRVSRAIANQSFLKPNLSQNFNSKPVQRKANENLPEDLQSKMEDSFGQDFSNVTIQKNSQEAVDLNARAFTQGENIHFAPGEFNPNSEQGKNLIGHEFTHVAQQRSGAVRPTSVMGKGLDLNDDRGLESEADSFGQKAVKGEPVGKYRSSSLGIRNNVRVAQAKAQVIQRAINTFGGTWDTDEYKLRKDEANGKKYPPASGLRGVDIKLKFTPGNNADAELIGITQTAQSTSGGKHPFIDGNASREKRAISKGTERGTMIDRADKRNNPIYGSKHMPIGGLENTPMNNNSSGKAFNLGTNATYRLGYRKKTGKKWNAQSASLYDGPTLPNASKDSQQIFESTALALKGNQEGTYYGSVQWGWRTSDKGKHELIPFKKVKEGVPSGKFMRAAKVWNSAKDSTGKDTIDLPIQWTGTIQNTPLAALRSGKSTSSHTLADLPRGTRLTVLNDTSNWHHVQLDKNQTGIILNQRGQASTLTGNLIRGYVSKELINKDADYR